MNDNKVEIQVQFSLAQSVTFENFQQQLPVINDADNRSEQESSSLNKWENNVESGESVMDLARSLHGAICNTSTLRTSLETVRQAQEPAIAISSIPISKRECPPEDEITKEFHEFLMTFPDGSRKISDWIENWNRKAKSQSTDHSLIAGESGERDDDLSLHSTDSLRYYDRKRLHQCSSMDSDTDD
jgi:hypothetical protein